MSEFYLLWEDFFTGRKPSRAQVMAKIKTAIKQGAGAIQISWGENRIDLDQHRGQWKGSGHIREISGWDIAISLNSEIIENARTRRRAAIATLNTWNS
jgi:hypothetical protein